MQRRPFRKKKVELTPEELQQQLLRTRLPRGREVFGIVEKRLGASRMEIRCMDGKTRICRIPGRMKRFLWVREGDYVIVEPWEYSGDDKGDVIYKYNKTQVNYLNNKGYFKQLEAFEEFLLFS